jgi:peptide/nickel transport system permease protein
MRGMMITTMGEDYMKLAEYKGLSDRRIFLRYAVRNAMLPQITGLAIQMAFIVSGSVLVEVIFAYPGVGYLLFQAISANDFLLMQGILMFVIVAIGVSLLVIDLLYPLIDPRIRYLKA